MNTVWLNIIWEWKAWVVVDFEDKNYVVKIPKAKYKWLLDEEYNYHKKSYDVLQKGMLDYPNDFSGTVSIPNVEKIIFQGIKCLKIEKVTWISLKTKFYHQWYKYKLSTIPWALTLNDYELSCLIDDLGLDTIAHNYLPYDELGAYFSRAVKSLLRSEISGTEIGKVLDYLESRWLPFKDINPWNFIVKENGESAIIDFWSKF